MRCEPGGGGRFEVAFVHSVGGGRLEEDGESLLRSMRKLAQDGHVAFEKGGGIEIKLWLAELQVKGLAYEKGGGIHMGIF